MGYHLVLLNSTHLVLLNSTEWTSLIGPDTGPHSPHHPAQEKDISEPSAERRKLVALVSNPPSVPNTTWKRQTYIHHRDNNIFILYILIIFLSNLCLYNLSQYVYTLYESKSGSFCTYIILLLWNFYIIWFFSKMPRDHLKKKKKF